MTAGRVSATGTSLVLIFKEMKVLISGEKMKKRKIRNL